MAMRFGADYCEDITLPPRAPDGASRIRIRCLRPDDKQRLAEGLKRLSPRSQYLRFFTEKDHLTEAELAYFTEVDGTDHFALGATLLAEDGAEGDGIAVGRFVRLQDDPHIAEAAIAVVDSMQRRGIGRMLMQRLIEAARERDIERFRGDFLSVNKPVRELLRSLSSEAQFTADGPVVVGEFPLEKPDGPMYEWLRLVARQAAKLRQRLLRPLDPDS